MAEIEKLRERIARLKHREYTLACKLGEVREKRLKLMNRLAEIET